MVTQEEMNLKKFRKAVGKKRASFQVTSFEMERFSTSRELSFLIGKRKRQFEKENKLKATPAYEELAERCEVSTTSLKKSINGSQKVTRTFLYKFCVGLNMTVEEANEYFSLCGGVLKDDSKEDYICMRALEDGDNIYDFISQFEQYTNIKISR